MTVYRDTALHSSARRGRVAATCLLLARGADALARNRFGKTPRDWAQQERQLATLVTLHAMAATRACCNTCLVATSAHRRDGSSAAKDSASVALV